MNSYQTEALWRGTTPVSHSPLKQRPIKKRPALPGKDASRGTTLHLYSASRWYQKAPVHFGTGAKSRYHPALYFNG